MSQRGGTAVSGVVNRGGTIWADPMTGLRALRKRASQWLSDLGAGNRPLREAQALCLTLAALLPIGPRRTRLGWLLVAARRTSSTGIQALLRARFAPWLEGPRATVWREQQIGMSRYRGEFGGLDGKAISHTLVVKAPGPGGEKGVLYSSFEYNWVRLLDRPSARELLQRYYLVGASSWSPPDYAVLTQFAGLQSDPVLMGISHRSDIASYGMLRPVVEPLPLMACDWIDPDRYAPKPKTTRSIDILMVANWLPFKRHWLLFEALGRMRRDLRVVLVGHAAPGRTADVIRAEARLFGCQQDLELYTSLSIDEVTELQCDAKISALFSQREGSCVAVVESMFANTPVAMMRGAHIGSSAYINDHTGMFVTRNGLDRQLSGFLERHASFHPRTWISGRVSYQQSSARMNDALKLLAYRAGRPWTTDIADVCWRPLPTYANPADAQRFADAEASLERDFGVVLERK